MCCVKSSRSPLRRGRAVRFFLAASLTVTTLVAFAATAWATPLNFTLVNVNSSNQSRLEMVAKASINSVDVTVNTVAQVLPSGSTAGSLSTLYNDTASNDSKLLANVTQTGITFGGGSTAVASNGTGLFSLPLQISPNVGGTSGTAPANYGLTVTSPQNIPLPAVDLALVGLPGTMLNLGTIVSFDAKLALRDVVIGVTGPASLALSPAGTPPPTQTFDSSQLQIGISGNTDILLGATVQSANLGDKLALHLALPVLNGVLAPQGISLTYSTPSTFSLFTTIGFGFTTPLPATISANDDATLGTLEHILSPNKYRITVPVKFDVVPTTLPAPLDMLFTAQLGLSGKLIGETPFVVVDVPEPSSVALAAMGLLATGIVAVRRRRRG